MDNKLNKIIRRFIVNKKSKKEIIHKYITEPRPTKHQKDAVKICYLCNEAVKANWRKTDITNKKVNCKNCKRKEKHIQDGTF